MTRHFPEQAALAVVAALLLCAAAPGAAAAAGDEPAPRPESGSAAPASRADSDAARQHFEQGELFYSMGRFADAIVEYEQAYALSHAPRLLFNLAQAHRLAGNRDKALYLYRSFLREEPDAPFRADVEQHIRALSAVAADSADKPDSGVSAPEHAVGGAAPVPPGSPRQEQPAASAVVPQVIGGVLAGLGVVSLLAGTAFALNASAASAELSELAVSGGTWDAAAAERYQGGQRDQVVGVVGLAVGGVLLAGGGALIAGPWLLE